MKACFFSHVSREQLIREQYSLQDIRLLSDLGFEVTVATRFSEIPWDADVYLAWWAAGSVLPLIKAKLSGRPIIVIAGGNETMFYRDSITSEPAGYISTPWYKKLATRITLRLADRVLVVSRFMLDDAKVLGARDPQVVYNSVDCARFNVGDSRREYVTSIFKLDEKVMRNKRAEILIRAMRIVCDRYPHQKLLIIGEKGTGYASMYRMVADLRLERNVEFLGTIDNEEVPNWLNRSKLYIQISDTETFGVAVAEAMSCGCPVVLSSRGALPEVAGTLALYVNHNDPESVAAGIVRILSTDVQGLDALGRRGRDRIVESFSYERRRQTIKNIIFGSLGVGGKPRETLANQ